MDDHTHDPLAQRSGPADHGPLFAPAPKPPPSPPPAIAHPPLRPPTPMQARILAAICRLGGRAAIWQVAVEMRLPDHCISQRFSELVDRGHLVLTGDTNRRPISHKVCKIYAIPDSQELRP